MQIKRREPIILLIIGIILLAWSSWAPTDRMVWVMEVLPAVIGALILCIAYHWFPLIPLSYRLIFLFSILLIVGGHYTYSHVPLGFWVQDIFGLSRNHYDRLGHFMQGIVPALLAREVLLRTTPLRPGKMLFFLCVAVAVAISGLYEIVEWLMAIWIAPEQGTAFLGTQGDEWDAQKDILMALIGAIIGQLIFARRQDRELNSTVQFRNSSSS